MTDVSESRREAPIIVKPVGGEPTVAKRRGLLLRTYSAPFTMALVIVPWLAVVFVVADLESAFAFLGYVIVALTIGYSIVSVALPSEARGTVTLLAPAAGIMAISGLTEFLLRLGISVVWAPLLWLLLMPAGAWSLWKDRSLQSKVRVDYAAGLAILSLFVCLIYFLPGARKDAVLQHDGSFNWIYVDTEAHYAIAADIKSGDTPPKTYGTHTAELYYHFGPYAPSAVISRLTGLNLGDAFARVTRGASIWALLLSCFVLGTLLSLRATGEKLGGFLSAVGLFGCGSLLALFTDEKNSSSPVTGALLRTIPNVGVQGDGGPFSHLVLGHSMVHCLGAMTVIMSLCLVQRGLGSVQKWRELILLVLPCVAIGVHSVGALYCVGVVAILLYWGRLNSLSSWLSILLMFCLFIGTLKIAGYGSSSEAGITTLNHHPGDLWWTFVVWLLAGLGFRILAFRWISKPLENSVSVLVLVSVVGLLAFNLLVQTENGDERYGQYILQSLFSIFAFSRLRSGFWRGAERTRWITEWMRLTGKAVAFFIAYAVLMRILDYMTHTDAWISYNRAQMVSLLLVGLVLVGMSALMKRSRRISLAGSAILMGVLAIGLLGWIPAWVNFGLGRMRMDVSLSSGEVQGLTRLRELAKPNELFATNKHAIDSLPMLRERSYGYAALAERPVLLEGYDYRGVRALPWFDTMLYDNDLMFTTTDAQLLHADAAKWHVQWLVARPGTDIALPRPLPPWLAQQQNTGDLRIYRID